MRGRGFASSTSACRPIGRGCGSSDPVRPAQSAGVDGIQNDGEPVDPLPRPDALAPADNRTDYDRALQVALQESEARALLDERERTAAERAAGQAEAAEQARKEDERRRVRLLELVAEVEAAAADQDLPSARRRLGLAQREWDDLTGSRSADGDVSERYSAAQTRVIARDTESR